MVTEEMLRNQMVIIGEGDPGDLVNYDRSELAELGAKLAENPHRDAISAVSMVQALIKSRREMF